MSLSRDYRLTLLHDLGHSLFWPRLSTPWTSASLILTSFFILLGIIFLIPLVWLRSASGLIVSVISGPIIFRLIPLLSQEPD
jgi:hypothetical protein